MSRKPTEESEVVSIIIPTFNRVESLEKVMSSYLEQRNAKEIMLVDDGSTDATEFYAREMQKNHPKIRYVKNDANRGLPGSRNIGIGQASGKYILFGEDDLVFADDYCEQLLKCMDRHPEAGAVAGRLIYLRKGESPIQSLKRTRDNKGFLIGRHMLAPRFDVDIRDDTRMPYVHACALIKREVFDKVLFDEEYKVNALREESDFFIRVNKAGYEVYLCPSAACFHLPRAKSRGGVWSTGILKYQWWAIKNNNRFINKHYSFLKENPGLKGGKLKFIFLHALNRVRHLILYFLRRE